MTYKLGQMEVILNNLRSAHNVGSIFRTSDTAGIRKVYLCGHTPSPIKKQGVPRIQLTKVSLGAENFVEWEVAQSAINLIEKLKSDGKNIISVEQSKKSIPYNQLDMNKDKWEKSVLVMGSEVEGLEDEIIKKSNEVIMIPMLGKKKSLNVSVAFGVVAFNLNPHIV